MELPMLRSFSLNIHVDRLENDTGICSSVRVRKSEGDVLTWINVLTAECKNAVKGTAGERTRSKCPIFIHWCPRIQKHHTRHISWTFLLQLESSRFDAVKAWLPCRPGRCGLAVIISI
jgi:hypothetical protein